MGAPRVFAALLSLGLALLSTVPAGAVERTAEPNTLVPAGASRYVATAFPDRIVATPAEDAARGFAVAWRSGAGIESPWLEIVVAGDSPDMGVPRRIRARTRMLTAENGPAHHHRADVDGLRPGTLYAYRVQGDGAWSPWMQLRTAGLPGEPLELLYFGDTQNKNASLTTRVVREAMRHAPRASLVLYAGDLVSGGDGDDDNEWGEWFDATDALSGWTLTAPAPGNHEYFEEFEDTPRERRVLGRHWPLQFALPGNGIGGDLAPTTYWFDHQGVRVAVLDGTSALDLGSAARQARWLDAVLASNPGHWSIVVVHQPFFSPRDGRENAALREHLLPVLRARDVDLVLQGHDHTYGRRGLDDGSRAPVFVVSVAGAKQYRLSDEARATMAPVGEDTQWFQVIRIVDGRLSYEARTATGRLYDAFDLVDAGPGPKRVVERAEGRIAPRDCVRDATLKGRRDRCWE